MKTLSPDAAQRADELTAEFRRSIERELANDPASPTHLHVIMRALVRVLVPCLAAASRKEAAFWSEEINRAYGVRGSEDRHC